MPLHPKRRFSDTGCVLQRFPHPARRALCVCLDQISFLMDGKDLQEKLSSIKPYAFYGDEPPGRLSKEPSKILQPLMGHPPIASPLSHFPLLQSGPKRRTFAKGDSQGENCDVICRDLRRNPTAPIGFSSKKRKRSFWPRAGSTREMRFTQWLPRSNRCG